MSGGSGSGGEVCSFVGSSQGTSGSLSINIVGGMESYGLGTDSRSKLITLSRRALASCLDLS